jgi:RNA polymerase sigma factor (sigma-70 family)
MDTMDDSALLREYATERSETAFASLVQRHIHFVYSSALRQVRDAHLAEEVTQAVFIILARKAGRIRQGTVLAGWFFNTARFVAAAELRAAARRRKHEQEAGMESSLHQSTTDASWEQIAPFLDEGLAQLSEKDRQAVLLRFFEDKSFLEVGAELGANEDAARMRVNRALKSLRGFFSKRGLTLSIATLTAVLSANAIQAAPAGLVAAVTAHAALQGAAGTTSTAALVKAALKLMAWAKLKTGVLVSLGILLAAGTATIALPQTRPRDPALQTQKLPDGSILTLESVKIGWSNVFFEGRRTPAFIFPPRLTTTLDAQFRLSGATPRNELVNPSFNWSYRAVVSGEDGLEYSDSLTFGFEMTEEGFIGIPRKSADYYGYLDTGLFPRDSRRLRIQIQERDRDTKDAPWKTVAEFTHTQSPGADEAWQPEPAPVTRNVEGMQMNLGEVMAFRTNEPPWNWTVVIPWQLMRDGVLITNWSLLDPIIRDSSGNADHFGPTSGPFKSVTDGWIFSRVWQSPDPRKVWKIQAQLGQDSDFAETNVFTVHIPFSTALGFETNLGGCPFRIELAGNDENSRDHWIHTELLLTNRPDLRLNFLGATDQTGNNLAVGNVHGWQFKFSQWISKPRAGGEVLATFAIGKNIPVEFVVKPRLVSPSTKNERG